MLLGENGAGKSTLMKILSGAYRKDAGEIRINGRPVEIGSPRDALALGIRVIYQELNLVPQLSVAENIFLGAAPTRVAAASSTGARCTIARRALLADLGHGARSARAGRPPRPRAAADGGDRQGACAERSATRAMLVMDEPTSSLTSREVTQLFALIAAADRARRRDRLHHAPARRGVPHRPPDHRHARRPRSRDPADCRR